MSLTIKDLSPCTQYRLEIGAGPVNHQINDNQEDETIQQNLEFTGETVKTIVTTSPVSLNIKKKIPFDKRIKT